MRLIGWECASEFAEKHSNSVAALKAWRKNIGSNGFRNFVELKRIFGSADYVKPYTVFDIGGNKCRLIVLIDYELGTVSIKSVLTHP